MTTSTKVILNHADVVYKTRRIAYQIIEKYYETDELYIAGVEKKGYQLAEALVEVITKAYPKIKCNLVELNINKKEPINSVSVNTPLENLNNKNLIVVDDVLNSGKTLIYAVNYFLNVKLKSISTVVLVDRSHKRFPIKADFKGISLSTSMNSHIEVNLEDKNNYSTTLS